MGPPPASNPEHSQALGHLGLGFRAPTRAPSAAGDWFNRIDWSGGDNNFGVGLPPASKNASQWPLKRALLATAPHAKPGATLIRSTAAFVRALLRVR